MSSGKGSPGVPDRAPEIVAARSAPVISRSTPEAQSERILTSIRAGETWMARNDDDTTAATVALDSFSDPRLWTPEEQQQPAMYLHHLIARRTYSGLGADIIDWACRRAGELGNDWVRIDVWTDNTGLHRYYEQQGFRHVRTLDF